jgi:hypothetical protein
MSRKFPYLKGGSEVKIAMTMARRNPTTQMERRIESALAPVSYNVNFEFLRELETAEKPIGRMVLTKPGRAAPRKSLPARIPARSARFWNVRKCAGVSYRLRATNNVTTRWPVRGG